MGERPHAIGGEGDEFLAGLRGGGGISGGDRREERAERLVGRLVARATLDIVNAMHLGRIRG
jgi:hypothetical protein